MTILLTYLNIEWLLWAILDLNQGPMDYESTALTAELMARKKESSRISTPRIEINLYGDVYVLYYFLLAKQSNLSYTKKFYFIKNEINSLSLFSE